MHCIWAGACCKEECKLSKITLLVVDALTNALCYATCVMHIHHPGAQIWPGCVDANASFPNNCVLSSLHDVPRCAPLMGLKSSDIVLNVGVGGPIPSDRFVVTDTDTSSSGPCVSFRVNKLFYWLIPLIGTGKTTRVATRRPNGLPSSTRNSVCLRTFCAHKNATPTHSC